MLSYFLSNKIKTINKGRIARSYRRQCEAPNLVCLGVKGESARNEGKRKKGEREKSSNILTPFDCNDGRAKIL